MNELIASHAGMYYLALITGAAAFTLGAMLYVYHERNYHNNKH